MEYKSQNDSTLMKSVLAGDKDAFQEIIDRYIGLVSRTTYRILTDRSDSEDVTSEVFCRIWTSASEYDTHESLNDWILTLTCWYCRKYLRRRHLMYILGKHQDLYVTSEPLLPFEEDYISKQAWEIYCRASAKMNSLQRIIYAMVELEGIEKEKIGKLLGVGMYRVRKSLSVSRSKVIIELKRYGEVR